jgi:hypothetical protein
VSVIEGVVLLRSRRIVPEPEPVLTVTVLVVPEPDTLLTEAPLTPVVFREKLPVATPVTDSLKVTVKVIDPALVRVVVGTIEETVGAVLSTVRMVPLLKVAIRGLVAVSVIDGVVLLKSSRIVPEPVPVLTVTVQVVPEPDTLVTEAPVTPVVFKEKLPVATPETGSLKVTVKVVEVALVGVVVGTIEETVGAIAL